MRRSPNATRKRMKTRRSPEQGLFPFACEVNDMDALDAVDKIRWFMELPEARPGLPWDKEFENRAYIRWACSELTQDLMERLDIPAEMTIDAFWFRMLQFYHFAGTPKMSKIFQIAMDTADTIKSMI